MSKDISCVKAFDEYCQIILYSNLPYAVIFLHLCPLLGERILCLWVPGHTPVSDLWAQTIQHLFYFLLSSLLSTSAIHLVASFILLSHQCHLRVWTLPLRFPYSHKLGYVLLSKYIYFANTHHLFRKQQEQQVT